MKSLHPKAHRSVAYVAAGLVSSVLAVACSDTTAVNADQLNLNRPVDVAFACYGGLRITNGAPANISQDVAKLPQPLASCDARSQPPTDAVPKPVPPGQEDLSASGGPLIDPPGYYAFILQSTPGTVAVARWDAALPVASFSGGEVTVLDSDPLTPGKNGITIGEEPIAIQTDASGCFEVTANAGSCDMSTLDIDSALSLSTKAIVKRLDVRSSTGIAIHAKPAAMVSEPMTDSIGHACPAAPQGIMYVAYPSCHLVAGVDVSTGTVVSGIKYDAAGVPSIVTGAVSCPIDECGGGGSFTAGTRPVTVDLQRDPRSLARRLVIGAQNSNAITVVELDAMYQPLSLSQVAFEDPKGDLGFTTVALTPQIGMGGEAHLIDDDNAPGGQFQFVYGVATDHSVRVADILTLDKECDTQVDPRFAYSIKSVKRLACFPVGDPATPPRRGGARGPGIVLPSGNVPTSVAIFKSDALATDTRVTGGLRTIGYFGLITSTAGQTFVATLNDSDFYDTVQAVNPLLSPVPFVLAHQLRDALPNRGALADDSSGAYSCDVAATDPDTTTSNDGGPRTTADPTRGVPTGVIAAEKVGLLPNIRHVDCTGTNEKPVSELAFQAPTDVRDLAYPDLLALRSDETWTMTWEGSLSNDGSSAAVDGPGVRESTIAVDAQAMRIVDNTGPFCDAGVEPFDIVQLRGCDPANEDRDCSAGYTCFVHPQSQVAGLGACMLASEADRLSNACKEYLTSLRRYTIGPSPTSGQLVLLPRKHHLRNEPLDGCELANDTCQAMANYGFQLTNSANPRDATTIVDPHTYACKVDDARPPLAAGRGSCLETCTADADCAVGTVCDHGTCMEGVTPPQACVNAPQRYELRAHGAFALLGSQSGYVHPIIADASGSCVKDPTAASTLTGRIPLTAPACDPAADPRTGALPGGGFEPNPCLEATTETDLEPVFVGGTCAAGTPVLTNRPTAAVRFRNRGMTLDIVDPTYPGDASCTLDRAGNGLGNLPLVFTGYQLSWRVTAGFTPLTVPINPAFPVKVVRGPGQSLWIVDEGDFLSSTLGIASTLGKVFRVEAQHLNTVNTLQ